MEDFENIIEHIIDKRNNQQPVDQSIKDRLNIIEDFKQTIISSMMLYLIKKNLTEQEKKHLIETSIQMIKKRIIRDIELQSKNTQTDKESLLIAINSDLKIVEEQLRSILL